MTLGKLALIALVPYGIFLGAVLFLVSPWHFRLWLPLYGNDSIRLTPMAAVLIGLGVHFAAFGAWAMSRGVGKGFLVILIGCAAPIATESPVALVISIPTLVAAFGAAVLRGRERDRERVRSVRVQ